MLTMHCLQIKTLHWWTGGSFLGQIYTIFGLNITTLSVIFLAHRRPRLKVSYCDHWMSVVQRQSSVNNLLLTSSTKPLVGMSPYFTVSHFSYAPPFQGPHFFTKMLKSNILYAHWLIDILSVWWHRKNIKITHANHSATSIAILTKMIVQHERLYFIFAFCARN